MFSGLGQSGGAASSSVASTAHQTSHRDLLGRWSAGNLGGFEQDWETSYTLPAVDAVRLECLQGDYPPVELLSGWVTKAESWLRCLARFHFAGNPTERYSDAELGVADGDGECGENTFYRAFFQKLRECDGARTSADFWRLMDWLVAVDLLREFPNPEITRRVWGWFKTMRSELCQDTAESDALARQPFDPNVALEHSEAVLSRYSARFHGMKFHLIRILLEEATPELSVSLIDRWLHAPECAKAREWLFSQRLYPMNTFFDECYPWYAPLVALTQQMSAPREEGDGTLADALRFVQDIQLERPPEPGIFVMAFGRTLKSSSQHGHNCYLKIKSAAESEQQFIQNYNRLQVFRSRRNDFESETVCPVKISRIEKPGAYLSATGLSDEERSRVLEKVGTGIQLAMMFTTPQGHNYETYSYDVKDADQAMTGLAKYARDYGRLWRRGLLGPAIINAFHHFEGGRKHVSLPPYIGRYNEGAVESWCHFATDYPNAGDGNVGMRDMGDTYMPDEITGSYFDRQLADHSDPHLCTKLCLSELARTAEGLVMLHARRFNQTFDCRNPDNVEYIASEIKQLLTDLFSHAMPMDRTECEALMTDNDLLGQCSREIAYWLADDAPFVKDLRAARINRSVYPNLPDKMCGCVLTELQGKRLSDRGFVDRHRVLGKHPGLGSQSGRNPLIALSAMVTKLICSGAVRMICSQREQLAADAEMLRRQTLAA